MENDIDNLYKEMLMEQESVLCYDIRSHIYLLFLSIQISAKNPNAKLASIIAKYDGAPTELTPDELFVRRCV